jgi:hypothetical protein
MVSTIKIPFYINTIINYNFIRKQKVESVRCNELLEVSLLYLTVFYITGGWSKAMRMVRKNS